MLATARQGVEAAVVVVTGAAGVAAIGSSTISSEARALTSSLYW